MLLGWYMRMIWGQFEDDMRTRWKTWSVPGGRLCCSCRIPHTWSDSTWSPILQMFCFSIFTIFIFSEEWIILISTSLTARALSSIPCLMKASRSFFTWKYNANLMQTWCKHDANLMQTWCKLDAKMMQTWCKDDVRMQRWSLQHFNAGLGTL